jgi:hypothetical protein
VCAPARAQEPSAEPLRVLATGDSMMYVMQQPLARRLRHQGYEVKVDGRFGTGLTKSWILDWASHARSQVEEFQPDVTLVFIGAADVYPLGGVRCCGARWRALYGRRVRELIAIYGRTIWLTLPAPRSRGLARVFRNVNRAIADATLGRAEVVDLVPVFTPGARFRRTMVVGGRREIVRQLDGVHLWGEGVKIAADLSVAAVVRGSEDGRPQAAPPGHVGLR